MNRKVRVSLACSSLLVSAGALTFGFQNCSSGMHSIADSSVASPPIASSRDPRLWFAPLPPVNSVPGGGVADFPSLFTSTDSWPVTAKSVQVFKLYGEFFQESSAAQITAAVVGIKNAGMKLAVEAGPLPDTVGTCGYSHESFTLSLWPGILSSIKAAGSTLDYVDMDEPFYYATTVCNWTPAQIAANVKNFSDLVKAQFPNVVIGDAEPLLGTAPANVAGLLSWIDAYSSAVGTPLGWIHLDTSATNLNWIQDSLALQAAAGIPIGLIYQPGNYTSNKSWIAANGEYVRAALAGGFTPAHTVLQSWTVYPKQALPESNSNSFTSLVSTYITQKESLGFGAANLARNAVVTASAQATDPRSVTDNDLVSGWSSGTGAPGWIQLDLGAVKSITEIRLVVSQSPAGATVHEIYASVDGASWTLLKTFSGTTSDLQFLNFTLDTSNANWRFIKVQTQSSPSWVAWREIQVIDSSVN